MHLDSIGWAREEFGHAELGDQRRRARLIEMAAQAARSPHGKVTAVFGQSAAREAAFRFVESEQFSHRALLAAASVATARRAAAHRFVYVAADETGLQITDQSGRGFGPLCGKAKGTGAHAMSALAISPEGVPLGLAAMEIWTRSADKVPNYKQDQRPVEERETRFWLEVLTDASTVLSEHAPETLPWFQLDRGGDSATVLLKAAELSVAFTIRSSHDRRTVGARRERLHAKLAACAVLGTYSLQVRANSKRSAREAQIEVRACPVALALPLGLLGRGPFAELNIWAVEAREVGTDAPLNEPIVWRLLTSHVVSSYATAREVIDGYAMRWRVEEFHLAWKTGTCRIESSRLRTLEHFAKWATILATVAVRAQRLKTISRETPDLPAAVEFSRDEIDAVIALRKPKGVTFGATPSIGEVVRWIADIGGYTGKSSGGPPGVRIISRALLDVQAAAAAITALRAGRP